MQHHEVSSDEKAVKIIAEFDRTHAGHVGFGILRRGYEWGIYLFCNECNEHHTIEAHNEAHPLTMAGHKAGRKVYTY
jgi:hypothetical protein